MMATTGSPVSVTPQVAIPAHYLDGLPILG